MNRTIKDATVMRFHYDTHEQSRTQLADFLAAYNFARRLVTIANAIIKTSIPWRLQPGA